jgi:hypothetical protein
MTTDRTEEPMTEPDEPNPLPDLPPDSRGQRRVDVIASLLDVIASQAVYIEQLEVELDEVIDALAHEIGGEPEDPKWQVLRDAGVSGDEIARLKGLEEAGERPAWFPDPDRPISQPEADLAPSPDGDDTPPAWQPPKIDPGLAVLRAGLTDAEAVQDPPVAPPKLVRAIATLGEPAPQPASGPARQPRAPRKAAGQRIQVGQPEAPGVVLDAPLKTSPPRKASGHRIAPENQQWRRDAAGRRVPIDQED